MVDFFHFVNFHPKPDNSFFSPTGSLHGLMAVYAKLIFNNWSYYARPGGKTTKVKKPYLEQLIFRGLEHGLIPILLSVGVFPKLIDINIIPQLKTFDDCYNQDQHNKKREIRRIIKWIGEELIKPAPHSAPIKDKKDLKLKAVPRDVMELLLTALLQEGLNNKSLLLPHVAACMVRFVQTYDRRVENPVFYVGYLVDNSTSPTTEWLATNPSAYPVTPRHMRCIQEEFNEDEPKRFLTYFSDLIFEQPEGELPVALNLMTLVVFKNNNDTMFTKFREVLEAAQQYKAENSDEKQILVHLGQITTAKTRLSPAKSPAPLDGSKTNESTPSTTLGIPTTPTVTSPTTTSVAPPSERKRVRKKKKETPESLVHDDEKEWVKFVKKRTWDKIDLTTPATVWKENINNTETRLQFLKRILTFNKRVELSKWLATRPPERLIVLSHETKQDLTNIRTSLERLTWEHDIEQIKEEYDTELSRKKEEEEKEEKRRVDEHNQIAKDKRKRDEEFKKKVAQIKADADKQIEEVAQKAQEVNDRKCIIPFLK